MFTSKFNSMKTFFIIVAFALIAFIIFQSYTVMSANNTEEQKYTVVFKDKDIEIRHYPAATLATIKSNAKSYRELSGPGFRKLAGYIFGGNETKTSIAMTAPVHMEISDSWASMSFVMPAAYNENNLPKPNDSNVIIHKTAEEYVAVMQFGGYASDRDMKVHAEKLRNKLEEKGISSYGNFRYLGYNPPYQMLNRRNEIIVSVNWKQTE